MNSIDDWQVTVAIPYFQCKAYIGQAVASILNQTHTNLTLVVINDGDPTPPWSELDQIHDRRLVRFDLPENRGPFFALATVLEATSDPYFMVQDADDWSAPHRIATMLRTLHAEQADAALSANARHRMINGQETVAHENPYPARNKPLTERFLHRAMHTALYRSEALRRIGGYDGGVRLGYDTILTNLILMTGKLAYVDEPLYHRRTRPNSMTTGSATGFGSPARLAAVKQLRLLYQQAYAHYARYLAGAIDSEMLVQAIHQLIHANVTIADHEARQQEAARLRTHLNADMPAL